METDVTRTVVDAVRRCFFDTAIGDIWRCIHGGQPATIGAMILSLCAVDQLAFMANWRKGECVRPDDYKQWIEDNLGRIDERYKSAADELYSLRCALVHNYGQQPKSRKPFPFKLPPVEGCGDIHLCSVKREPNLGSIFTACLDPFVPHLTVAAFNSFEGIAKACEIKDFSRFFRRRVNIWATPAGSAVSTPTALVGDRSYGDLYVTLSCFDDAQTTDADRVEALSSALRKLLEPVLKNRAQ